MSEHTDLPESVRAELAQLDLELVEGDITQKGYEKKKAKLLAGVVGSPAPTHSSRDSNGEANRSNTYVNEFYEHLSSGRISPPIMAPQLREPMRRAQRPAQQQQQHRSADPKP